MIPKIIIESIPNSGTTWEHIAENEQYRLVINGVDTQYDLIKYHDNYALVMKIPNDAKNIEIIYMFTTYGNNIGMIQNIMIVATKNIEHLDEKDLLQLTIENPIEELSDTNFLENYQNYEIKTDDVPVLTDAFSPVETLINHVTSQPYFNENSIFSKNDSNIWFSESTDNNRSAVIGSNGLGI